jgi:lysophospholipase L1-like esterase
LGSPWLSSARRRWLAAAWLAACAAVIGPLSAELALRVRRASTRSDADRHRAANVFEQGREVREGAGDTLWQHAGVSYRPGARLSLVVGGEPYEIVINSHGFRSPEVPAAKRPGVLRVACIGGSTTVQGRTNDETYPAFLERKLRAALPGRDIEVLNLGINGVTSDHWLTRLDELFRFQPDVVVQYEFVNDLFFRHLPRFADDHAGWTRARRSLLVASLAPPSADDLEPYLRRTLRNIRETADVAEAHGARHVVGTFAGPDAARAARSFRAYLDINIESWGGRHGVRSYAAYDALRRDFNVRLRKAAAEGRLTLADVDTRLTDPTAYVDLCHLNARGIEAMAEAFLPAVAGALHE